MWWWVFLVWCSPNEHLFVSVVISELFFYFLRYRVKHDGPTSFMFTLILFLFISQSLYFVLYQCVFHSHAAVLQDWREDLLKKWNSVKTQTVDWADSGHLSKVWLLNFFWIFQLHLTVFLWNLTEFQSHKDNWNYQLMRTVRWDENFRKSS